MFQKFTDWLLSAFESLLIWFKSLVLTIWDLFTDFLIFVVDSLLSFSISILNLIVIPLDWNPSEYISSLPPEVTNMLGLLGLGECVSIISAALLIRLGLQLIPFVRLGS